MNYEFLERHKKTSFARDNEKARKSCEHGPENGKQKKCQGRLSYTKKKK